MKISDVLNEKEIRELQHQIRTYMQRYFKEKLGRGVDYTKVTICDDMLIITGEGFLTEPEKFIVQVPGGAEAITASRMNVVKQHIADNTKYFEEVLGGRVAHQAFSIEPEKNFWMHVMVFDRLLTEYL